MKPLSLKEIAEAVGGKLNNAEFADLIVHGISIDSRLELKDNLFIPIRGENFDGHEFIETATEKGAVCTLSENVFESGHPLIFVGDTREALKKLAKYYRSLFDVLVVAVTGSSGKTTTKDLIASVLSEKYNVLKTSGNYNNEVGLPLTLFNLDDTYDVIVLEMGMSNFGEIENLSEIARPDYAVITNIGDAHIVNLGSRDGILKAKCEIFSHLNENGKILLNGDDEMLLTLQGKYKNCYYYGSSPICTFKPSYIEYDGLAGVSFMAECLEDAVKIKTPLPGHHMVLNSLAAAAIGEFFGISPKEIAEGIAKFKPSAMRMDISEVNGLTVINDVYNANPASVKAVLSVLSNVTGRKVAILGDMLELGSFSAGLHFEIGIYAIRKKIDSLICIGKESRKTYDGALHVIKTDDSHSDSSVFYFAEKEEFIEHLDKYLGNGDTVLVKASRGMGFEEIISALKAK